MDMNDMYRAFEFAHHAERLRGSLSVVGLSRNTRLHDLLVDLKVVAAFRARVVLVVPDPEFKLQRTLALLNTHGGRFRLIEADEPRNPQVDRLSVNLKYIEAALQDDHLPVIAHHGLTTKGAAIESAEAMVRDIALGLNASRCIGLAQTAALEAVIKRRRVVLPEMRELYEALAGTPLAAWEPRLRFVETALAAGVPELTWITGAPGNLCQELFTHEGLGILFCRSDESVIRRAELRDVTDIMIQLRPAIAEGRILLLTENDIAEHIDEFWVHVVDDRVVSTVRAKHWGDWVELATGSTIIRERNRGRASSLMMRAIEELERDERVVGLFGLSIDPRAEAGLGSLGFAEIDRRELPEPWRRNYDMSRPSRAFAKPLRGR
jgi:N-acetylglutamate synthase-like GNAT family acetyltransferase